MKTRYEILLGLAILRAKETGWIEDVNDPFADLGCYGTFEEVNNNCGECPLGYLCEEIKVSEAH